MARSLLCLTAWATLGLSLPPAAAQQPVAPLQASQPGGAVRVPAHCTPVDVQELSLDCSAESPCPVFLELTSVARAGSRLLVAGNLHTRSTTLYSLLLASEDSGQSWTEAFPRQRQTGLDQLQFLNPQTGWVAGGTLALPPRDPFLLLTDDGGKTWRKAPLYGEPRTGVIDSYSFRTPQTGVLLVDRVRSGEGGRYERYESQTGGSSWMLREVSSTASAEPAPAQDSLRLRIEAASQLVQVEQRQGTAWQVLASFAIQAGECAPAEPPPVAPPTSPN